MCAALPITTRFQVSISPAKTATALRGRRTRYIMEWWLMLAVILVGTMFVLALGVTVTADWVLARL